MNATYSIGRIGNSSNVSRAISAFTAACDGMVRIYFCFGGWLVGEKFSKMNRLGLLQPGTFER